LRRFIANMAEQHGMPTLLRWNNENAVTVFAPAFSSDNQWHEVEGERSTKIGLWNRLERMEHDRQTSLPTP
jgi:hypothetical protein